MAIQISKIVAKEFLLQKQFLLPPRQFTGKKGIEKIFSSLRSAQYDPQNPCGRNIDLFLQARVSEIHPSDYYDWLYAERKGIETFDKELCVVPIEDLPLCKNLHPRSRKKKIDNFIKNNKEQLEKLLEQIEKNGPINSKDINDDRKVDIFWETARWGKVALDSLWKTGKLAISTRKNGFKYYDLPQKIYGKKFVWTQKNTNQLFEKQVLRRLQSTGMLPTTGTGQGWQGIGTGKEIAKKISELIQKKIFEEIQIKESKKYYAVISQEFKKFRTTEKKETKEKNISFLAPLDNLLWDRKMIKDIFDFDYTWEAYTPKKTRKFGHYVLPILYGTELIGRMEPRFQNGCLEIKGLWKEPNKKWNKKTKKALSEQLQTFKKYLNAKKIKLQSLAPTKY